MRRECVYSRVLFRVSNHQERKEERIRVGMRWRSTQWRIENTYHTLGIWKMRWCKYGRMCRHNSWDRRCLSPLQLIMRKRKRRERGNPSMNGSHRSFKELRSPELWECEKIEKKTEYLEWEKWKEGIIWDRKRRWDTLTHLNYDELIHIMHTKGHKERLAYVEWKPSLIW